MEKTVEIETDTSDADIFADAMANAVPDAPEGDKQPTRDESGRFASPVADVKAEPDKQPDQQEQTGKQAETAEGDGMVPPWRLREIREARDAARRDAEKLSAELDDARRQIAEIRQQAARSETKVEIPDPVVDPTGYQAHFSNALDSRMREMEANFSFRLAHATHKETFEKAYTDMVRRANAGDPSIVRQVMASPDPGENLIRWYKREQTIATVGDDPEAFKAKLLEDALKDEAYLAKAIERAKAMNGGGGNGSSTVRNITKLPPSLNRATGSAVDAAGDDENMSDKALLSTLLRR